ncbi:hypothetical protein [Ignicoccus islandicus]|uniref:hypothetical protein n=1 Tax=Ignicoccus islandicus TaxID=54259 RepID=UPI0012ED181E|nr:hypothetical protein [Ignicoccus islandicus]
MDQIEWVEQAFGILQWYFRARDVKLVKGEGGDICIPIVEGLEWRKGDDPEESFARLVEISEKFWSSLKCTKETVPIRYDPLMKAIIYDPEHLTDLLNMKRGKELSWFLLGASLSLHYLNHKSKFSLIDVLKELEGNGLPYLIIAFSNALKIAPWGFEGLIHFDNVLGRAALRMLAKRELIPLNNPQKIAMALIDPSSKLHVCLTKDFCFDIDIIKEAISMRIDDLKTYSLVTLIEAPNKETLSEALNLIEGDV